MQTPLQSTPAAAPSRAMPRELPATLGGVGRAFLRFASPWVLGGLALGGAAGRLAGGPLTLGDAAVAAGVLALWPLQEWLIHVFVLHYRPREVLGRRLDFRTPQLHRAHHREPWRLELVLIPLHVVLIAPLGVALFWWAAMPRPNLALTGFTVYFALALHYEWVHFLIHTRYAPRSRVYRRLWRNHRLHHFKNEHYWFGVTRLGGDRLLRTGPDPRTVPTSPTCRDLGLAEGSF